MYCLIENPNECPVEGFTVLGLSTARGNKEKIGQFGSGNKHGVLTCLRAGLNPVIFIGNDKLEFYSKPSLMGNKSYSAVWAVFKGQHMNLNMSLEFGELDWTSLEMSMREFISNAIDASDGDSSQVVIDVVDSNSLVGKAGYTRVFIPLTQDVQGYINRLRDFFLHWTENKTQTLIPKNDKTKCRIYRMGVFVRECRHISFFNYNFGHDLKIDEARIMDDWSLKTHAARAILDTKDEKVLKTLFHEVITQPSNDSWENSITGSLKYQITPSSGSLFKQVFTKMYGKDAVISNHDLAFMNDKARRRGYNVILVNSEWWGVLKNANVPTVLDCIDDMTEDGFQIYDQTVKTKRVLERIWKVLTKLGRTSNKPMPALKTFKKVVCNGETVKGFYKDNCVYINRDNQECLSTMLEEVAHYITGSTDMARDFQQYAFDVAADLIKSRTKSIE